MHKKCQQVKFQNLFRDGENEEKHYGEAASLDSVSGECQTVMTEGLWSVASIMEQYTEKYITQRAAEFEKKYKPWSIKGLKYQKWAVNPCQTTFEAIQRAVLSLR